MNCHKRVEAGGWKRKVRVNPRHYQHKAKNSGTVPPIPGRLATPGQGPKFRYCPALSGTVGNYASQGFLLTKLQFVNILVVQIGTETGGGGGGGGGVTHKSHICNVF